MMPARAERLTICPKQNGAPIAIVKFPSWWERRAFFEQYGARFFDTGNPIYVDYGLLLTGAEASVWDKRQQERAISSGRTLSPHSFAEMNRVASLLKTASWVIVESYEWESGQD